MLTSVLSSALASRRSVQIVFERFSVAVSGSRPSLVGVRGMFCLLSLRHRHRCSRKVNMDKVPR